MKRKFRIIVGMLLLAIPLCMNAQIKIAKPGQSKEGKDEKTEQEKPEKPKDGLEMPKISGFVQGMYQANLNEEFELNDNTFRMRRVRLSVDGKLSKTVSYKIQGDFVNSPMLVDAFVKYKPCNEFAIQLGQFKTPFTLESPINPVNLEIFDYGESVQNLVGYSDVCGVGGLGRDIGIMASGDLFKLEGKDFALVNYSIGVFNGNGPVNFKKNEKGLDNNNRKDVAGRLEVHPGMKALTLSGSYYRGQYKTSDDHGARNRWSAGAQYNDGKLVVRGEYIDGTTGYYNDIVDPEGNPIEQYRFSNGYYGVLGYNFQAGEQKIMPVLRYEHYAPGDKNNLVYGETNYYTAGINYWPLKQLNFKLDYSLIQHIEGEKTNSHRVVGILSYKF